MSKRAKHAPSAQRTSVQYYTAAKQKHKRRKKAWSIKASNLEKGGIWHRVTPRVDSEDIDTHTKNMATMLQLPNEEFFSDTYLDAFYRAHVASRIRGNLDEDIAAIEAEIKK